MNCKEVIFHFNKKHLEDPSIPPWVLKTKGQTYYINSLECDKPWSTKQTPDNPHTKGAIRIKNCRLRINENSEAFID